MLKRRVAAIAWRVGTGVSAETRLNEQAGSGGHDVVEVSPTFRIQGTLDGGLKIDRHIYIPYPLFYEYWRAPWND